MLLEVDSGKPNTTRVKVGFLRIELFENVNLMRF